jgi:predicted CopG family antitoxin
LIARATFGFNKVSYNLALSYISSKIKTDKAYVSKNLKELLKLNIIEVFQDSTNKDSKSIGINKNVNEWCQKTHLGLYKSTTQKSEVRVVEIDNSRVVENYNPGVVEKYNSGVVQNYNHNINNKNTYKNTYKNSYYDSSAEKEEKNSFSKFWELYPKRRGRDECYKYFTSKNLDTQIDDIIAGLSKAIATDYCDREKYYIPYPLTFLMDEQWKDYLDHDKNERKEVNNDEDFDKLLNDLKNGDL